MTLHMAIELFRKHQKYSVRDKTRESYGHLLKNVESVFGDRVLESIGSHDLYQFLIMLTEGRAKNTARLRYAQLKAFLSRCNALPSYVPRCTTTKRLTCCRRLKPSSPKQT